MKTSKRFLSLVLVIAMIAGAMTVSASAATSSKPADGTVYSEPFAKGTGGSNSFRIPALTTLSDGTVVAAADARWNTTYDGGGLDTIVARSSDDGATWKYTFANYLGDNGNTYSGSGSTAFIDPALAVTADDTIYMLVDLYPYGVALNGSGNTAPVTTKGFNSNGKLLLRTSSSSSYSYYLDNGKIYSSSGSAVSGYTVDEYFNIYSNGTYVSNLFFSDSPYMVVRTGFLYLTKSTDKGATWSAPELLNLKTTSEMVCLVAPGRGLVTESGTIIFPVYSYHGDNSPSSNTQRMSFIYSVDGETWSRTSEFNYNWASESAVVELSDGTLRFFFRNGTTNLCYVDYNMSTNSWGSTVNTGLDTNSNCQISAISYSKTSGGNQVILVSCPTGPSEAGSNQSGASYRLNGKIFIGLVNDNKTMNWSSASPIKVTSNNNQFMYSCLTELADGSVAILYENLENAWGAGSNCYYTMDYKVYDASALGLTFDAAVEHNYEAVVTAPTCTESGYVTYTCSICGDSYTEAGEAATGHNYSAVVTAPTCLAQGYTTYTCASCGDSYQVAIAALGHDYQTVTVNATCEEAGSVTTTCSRCGDSSVKVIEALGHNYKLVTVNATCEENGSYTYTCSTCGHSYAETIAALGHKYETVTVAATCEKDGSVTITCKNCGDSTVTVIPAKGHKYESVTVAATCEKAGSITTTCANCGDRTVEVIEALGHKYETVTVAATCEEAGAHTHTCAVCGSSYVEEIKALGHDYETVNVGATCEQAGSVIHTCTVCGDSYTENVDALGHDYEVMTVAATCELDGSVTYTCSRCGSSYIEVIEALGHQYETETLAATCENDGYIKTTCANCGDYTVEVLEAFGHAYETETVAATCENDGYIKTTCANCGDYTVEVLEAYGHAYETETVEATCEEVGSVTTTCVTCGETETKILEALGHDYETVTVEATCEEAGSVIYTCSRCGNGYTEVIEALGHDYETVTVEATCEQAGSVTTTCANCGDTTAEVIEALGHAYETVTMDATCEQDGYIKTTCANCGDTTTEVLEALGHDYESVTVEATCTENGYTKHTCTVCDDSYTSDEVAAYGHSYSNVEDGNYMVYTCDYCGHSYSESIAVEYEYGKVTAFTSGERYVITLYSNRKYYAVTHTNNKLSVTQVTVSSNQITSEITEDMLWTYSGSKLYYQDGSNTYYLYAGSSNGGGFGGWFGFGSTSLSLSTSNSSTVSFSSSRLKVGSNYLRYSNGSVTLNRSATTTYLFEQSEK